MTYRAEIPYGCYWTTPFARWQGALASLHPVEFAGWVTRRELGRRAIEPAVFDHGVLGLSVPSKHSFYGMPWLAGLAGLGHLGGPTLMQACATGVRVALAAAQEIESGMATVSLAVTSDRTSNGPHLYYPDPRAPGGTGGHEDWVLDNFGCDPLGPHSMLHTAETVAAKHHVGMAEQHDVVLLREAQYRDALVGDRAFQRRYMTLPFEVPTPNFRRIAQSLDGDEGVRSSTPETLARLSPVTPNGTVSFGAQTYPADGHAALVLAAPEQARELSRDPAIRIRLLGFGQARAALAQAGLGFNDLQAIKTHNPFALNDVLFSRASGWALHRFNRYGSSLVWGHPQAPMGTRSIIELIEELVLAGGGRGLFTGCAAGDTAMAIVIEVGDA